MQLPSLVIWQSMRAVLASIAAVPYNDGGFAHLVLSGWPTPTYR